MGEIIMADLFSVMKSMCAVISTPCLCKARINVYTLWWWIHLCVTNFWTKRIYPLQGSSRSERETQKADTSERC